MTGNTDSMSKKEFERTRKNARDCTTFNLPTGEIYRETPVT